MRKAADAEGAKDDKGVDVPFADLENVDSYLGKPLEAGLSGNAPQAGNATQVTEESAPAPQMDAEVMGLMMQLAVLPACMLCCGCTHRGRVLWVAQIVMQGKGIFHINTGNTFAVMTHMVHFVCSSMSPAMCHACSLLALSPGHGEVWEGGGMVAPARAAICAAAVCQPGGSHPR